MAEYKQPKVIPTVDVYNEPNKEYLRKANVSVANTRSGEYPGTKTDGIKIRGTGAATKGVMARGPMA